MLVCNINEIIIHGTTSKGKTFRPSDWSERLCGILSSFDKCNRLSYHEWVRPILVDNVRCVGVDKKLEQINPAMFRFLMDFAADNDLRVMDCEVLEQEREQKAQAEQVQQAEAAVAAAVRPVAAVEPKATETAKWEMREIGEQETAEAFAALSILRPMLTDVNRFVEQVNQLQRPQGYRLIGIFEEGKHNAVAVCGFHQAVNLVNGVHTHIDDLVVIPNSRSRGHASRLLKEVAKISQAAGVGQIHVDSNIGSERSDARRFYFRHGFDIVGYHFACDVASIR